MRKNSFGADSKEETDSKQCLINEAPVPKPRCSEDTSSRSMAVSERKRDEALSIT